MSFRKAFIINVKYWLLHRKPSYNEHGWLTWTFSNNLSKNDSKNNMTKGASIVNLDKCPFNKVISSMYFSVEL